MNHVILALCLAVLLSAGTALAQESPTGLYFVLLNEDVCESGNRHERAARAIKEAQHVADTHNVQPRSFYGYALRGFSAALSQDRVNALRKNPNVRKVVADGFAYPTAYRYDPGALDRVDDRLGLDGTFAYHSTDGTGVMVWLLDSGLGTGSSGSVTYPADIDGRVVKARNFAPGDKWSDPVDAFDTEDCISTAAGPGHGTQVASIAGGSNFGVSPAVQFGIAKTSNCDGITAWTIFADAAEWILSQHVAGSLAVVNISLAGAANEDAVDTAEAAVTNLVNAGLFVVVGAGNTDDGRGADACLNTPARMGPTHDGIITVGASDAGTDAIHSISDTGSCVEIFAPTMVKATNPNGDMVTFPGTSAATPVVSGVAAKFARKLYSTYNVAPSPAYLEGTIMGKATTGVVQTEGALAGTPDILIYSIWR